MKKSVVIAVCAVLTAFVSSCAQRTENTGNIVFTVNGEPVLQEKWDTYSSLRKESNPYITDDEIMDSYVRQMVTVQEAQKRGITASDAEIDALIESSFAVLEQDAAALAAVQDYVDKYGMTMDEYKEQSRETYEQAVLGDKLHAELDAEAVSSGTLPENYYEDYIDNLVETAVVE